MRQLVSLAAGYSVILSVLAGTVETDLTGTTAAPVSGWEYNVGSEYADGSLKLDKTGSSVTSEIYPGAVTSLTIRIKGNSTTGGNTVLELYGSTDGTTFLETPLARIAPTTAAADHETVLDVAQGFIRFKWVLAKDKGNIGFYAVTAVTDDTPITVPPPPPAALAVTDRTESGFILTWTGSAQATNYLVSVFCLTGTPATVTQMGFDGYPETDPAGWTINLNGRDPIYDSSTYSGTTPPALKLTETGHGVETPMFERSVATLSFWSKATGKDSALRIEADNGSGWVTVDTYPVGTSAATAEYAFDPEKPVWRIKITLEKSQSANVALDDVTLTTDSSLAPSNVVDRALTGSETAIQIGPLPDGTYFCRVVAQNEAGESPASEILEVVLGDSPEPESEVHPQAAIPLKTPSGSYTQSFDALDTASVNVWTNGVAPLPGWYAFADAEPCVSYRGGGSGGGIWSLPDAQTGQALGSQGANGQTYRYGLSFTNETEATITAVEIAFTAAQRMIGKSEVANLLPFSYRIAPCAAPLFEGSWLRVPDLCFLTPVYGEGLSGATNVIRSLSATLPLTLPPGGVLSLRWTDVDDPGTDHRFTIDDFSFSWRTESADPTALPVPLAGREERFDAVLVEPGAALPPFWRTGSEGLSVDGVWQEEVAGLFSKTAPGGLYPFCGVLSLDTTLAAWLTPACPTLFLLGTFSNGTPQKIQRWKVTATLKKMGSGTVPATVTLWASREGVDWTACGTAGFAADAGDAPPAWGDSPQAEQRVVDTVRLDHAIAPGERFYLAWSFSTEVPLTQSNAQVIGVDDLFIVPVIPQGTVLILE
ncbi:MAG: hypothetical protein J6336_06825 [Kiritimatiellae bacterium]|nr:hypothetical protein [Kiritimatiellia bacterium]